MGQAGVGQKGTSDDDKDDDDDDDVRLVSADGCLHLKSLLEDTPTTNTTEALTKGLTATIGALPPKRRQYLSGAAKRAQGMGGGGKGRRKSKSGAQKRREGSGGLGKGPIPSGARKRRDGSGGGRKKKPRA